MTKVNVVVAMMIAALVTDAQGQNFKRFKEKTKFNPSAKPQSKSATNLVPSNRPTAAPSAKAPTTSQQKTDSFGRSQNTNDPRLKKADTFVNLNPETAFGPEVITDFNYKDATLEELTNDMQKLTGINLVIPGQGSSIAGKGKIQITTSTPITVGQAWQVYLTVLSNNGFTLVKSGAFYKIVNNRDIRYTPTKVYTGNYTPDTDNYAMRILPLKNIDAKEVVRSFRPFMSRYGRIMPLEQTNTILIQDTGSNINRLVRLIRFTDVPGFEESLQIIPVKNSSAQEIAKLLDQILKGSRTPGKFTGKGATASKKKSAISKIIAEPRTNTIIAMTNSDGARQLRELIAKLDVKNVSRGGGRIHIYYLQHGTAETLAQTLQALVGSAGAPTRNAGRRSTLRRSTLGAPQAAGSSLFSDEVKITADKENNAIVVTASPTDYLTLKEVIAKLDLPRDQVFVEGLMMETNVEKTNNFGISFIGAYGTGGLQRGGFNEGGSGSGLIELLTGQVQALGGFFSGIGLGKKVQLNVPGSDPIEVSTVNGLIQAIARDSSTNVLATPQILALDNTEATFEVGEQVPITEQITNANGTTQNNVRQQKIALTLKITPQINKVTRFVKLKINQTIEDFSTRPLPSGLANNGVATTNRSADTTVVVRDKDTIAMGGLMRDKETHSVGKVPLLGDIPVLGWLFRNSEKTVSKVNMLFFLTPRILANYQRDNAANVKDLLNRRKTHLKTTLGEDDPYNTTSKGLYDKVKKQEQGPLYDQSDRKRYRDDNDSREGIGNDLGEMVPPNYQQIYQEVSNKKAATKRP